MDVSIKKGNCSDNSVKSYTLFTLINGMKVITDKQFIAIITELNYMRTETKNKTFKTQCSNSSSQ